MDQRQTMRMIAFHSKYTMYLCSLVFKDLLILSTSIKQLLTLCFLIKDLII